SILRRENMLSLRTEASYTALHVRNTRTFMRFAIAAVAALSVLATAANAQTTQTTTTKKKPVTVSRNYDRTVIISRGEDGKTRTRIVVQKRSFLDPGTQVFPGEVAFNDSIQAVQFDPFGPQRGTALDRMPQLPRKFELPFSHNPYVPIRDGN